MEELWLFYFSQNADLRIEEYVLRTSSEFNLN